MKKLTLLLSVSMVFLWFHALLNASAIPPQRMAVTKVKDTALSPAPHVNNDTFYLESPELTNIDFISRALIKQKSVQVVEQGSPGMLSNLFIRGSKSVHNAVMIDGVQMNSSSDGGGYDFSQVLVDDYKDVTIAPNPSVLNQSHATGGAILLKTKQGHGKPTAIAQVEQSTYPSRKINIHAQGDYKKSDIFLSVTNFQSGNGSRTTFHQNRIADQYQLETLTANLGLPLTRDLSLRAITHLQSSSLRLNSYQGTLPWFIDERQKTHKYDGTINILHQPCPCFKHQLVMTQAQRKLNFTDPAMQNTINYQNIFIYQFDWQFTKHTVLNAVFENRWEQYTLINSTSMKDNPKFLNANIKGQLTDQLDYQVSTRLHHLGTGQTYFTYQVNSQYKLNDSIKLNVGYGKGLRPPYTMEVHGSPPYLLPNPALSPENSHNFEVGFQTRHFNKKLLLDINFFLQ